MNKFKDLMWKLSRSGAVCVLAWVFIYQNINHPTQFWSIGSNAISAVTAVYLYRQWVQKSYPQTHREMGDN